MKKNYYLFNPGRMSRKDNTLKFVPVDDMGTEGAAKYLPIETIDELYVFGSLDSNSALYNFLGREGVAVHFFDFYEHYTGSFMPRDYLLAGKVQVAQTRHYLSKKKRMVLARSFVEGAAFNMQKTLRYYNNREKDVSEAIGRIDELVPGVATATEVDELMGIEGNIRMAYYSAFDTIVNEMKLEYRSKQPPHNELNALISFVNMLCYTACLGQIRHTQMNPTISFLHEPGMRRYSLALDLAEIFKPIITDRVVFSLINKRIITKNDFRPEVGSCVMKEGARKEVVRAFEEKMNETVKHRTLDRHVSYKHLMRLECYKLIKHVVEMETYRPFKMWW